MTIGFDPEESMGDSFERNLGAIEGTIERVPFWDVMLLKGSSPEHLVMGTRDTKSFPAELKELELYP